MTCKPINTELLGFLYRRATDAPGDADVLFAKNASAARRAAGRVIYAGFTAESIRDYIRQGRPTKGIVCRRAPWADRYGTRAGLGSAVPKPAMIEHGLTLKCERRACRRPITKATWHDVVYVESLFFVESTGCSGLYCSRLCHKKQMDEHDLERRVGHQVLTDLRQWLWDRAPGVTIQAVDQSVYIAEKAPGRFYIECRARFTFPGSTRESVCIRTGRRERGRMRALKPDSPRLSTRIFIHDNDTAAWRSWRRRGKAAP